MYYGYGIYYDVHYGMNKDTNGPFAMSCVSASRQQINGPPRFFQIRQRELFERGKRTLFPQYYSARALQSFVVPSI